MEERERESGSREEGKGWNRERSSVKRGDRLERKLVWSEREYYNILLFAYSFNLLRGHGSW